MDTPKTNTPFAMSFDEIKAQADANMAADRGEKPAQQTPSQAQAQPAGGGKSFLDMVEEAEHKQKQDGDKEDKAVSSISQFEARIHI